MEKSYIPSPDEMEKAEGMMTKKEAIMSRERAGDYAKLSEEMIKNLEEGKYDLKFSHEDTGEQNVGRGGVYGFYKIEGTIDNVKVKIKYVMEGGHSGLDRQYTGTIDGETITDGSLLQDILWKYASVARLLDNDRAGFLGIIGKHEGEYTKIANSEIKEERDKERATKEESEQKTRLQEELEMKKQKKDALKEKLKDIL
jgi:hypothetical protein